MNIDLVEHHLCSCRYITGSICILINHQTTSTFQVIIEVLVHIDCWPFINQHFRMLWYRLNVAQFHHLRDSIGGIYPPPNSAASSIFRSSWASIFWDKTKPSILLPETCRILWCIFYKLINSHAIPSLDSNCWFV